jgi:cytochrome P450
VANLAKMRYINAVIEEGLRMFTPAPVALPRVSPKGGAMVCGRFVPEGVSSGPSYCVTT